MGTDVYLNLNYETLVRLLSLSICWLRNWNSDPYVFWWNEIREHGLAAWQMLKVQCTVAAFTFAASLFNRKGVPIDGRLINEYPAVEEGIWEPLIHSHFCISSLINWKTKQTNKQSVHLVLQRNRIHSYNWRENKKQRIQLPVLFRFLLWPTITYNNEFTF